MNKSKIKEYNKNWKKRNKNYFKEWNEKNRDKLRKYYKKYDGNREAVLERDNWQCVKCGMTNEQHIVIFARQITIDHIDGNGRYSDNPNNNIENLQTLCCRCHGRKDNQYIRRKKVKEAENLTEEET